MKANALRWCMAVLMLLAISFLLPSHGLAEEFPAMNQPGKPLIKSGWISETEYQDDTIHATLTNSTHKAKSSATKVTPIGFGSRFPTLPSSAPPSATTAMTIPPWPVPRT